MIKLQIVGNLGRDGVVREVNGKSVINFSVAHTERYKDSSGNQKELTTWVDCSYWTDRTAVAPYLKKGTLVYVEGTPSAEAYTGKDGNAGVALRLRVQTVQLLGSKSDGTGGGAEASVSNGGSMSNGAGGKDFASEASDISDDLPF
jgi:single-strand DNA-binding protein